MYDVAVVVVSIVGRRKIATLKFGIILDPWSDTY